MKISKRTFCVATLASGVMLQPAWASAGLATPAGAVVLTIYGAIDRKNAGDEAQFDREMLMELDWIEIETYTSFTSGPQRFAGPTLASVLAAVGVRGGQMRASAINDYTVSIPVSDAAQHDVILAMDVDGTPMRVRDKGPIWVVYPQSEEEAEKKNFDGEMIWQLERIRIE
ncbi:MAG: molybdopterin-dependent oxidoreductase [Pseudomonadota bacterium]